MLDTLPQRGISEDSMGGRIRGRAVQAATQSGTSSGSQLEACGEPVADRLMRSCPVSTSSHCAQRIWTCANRP